MKLVEKGRFSKSDQNRIQEMFGERTANGLKSYLSEINSQELEATVFQKLQIARHALSQLIPLSFLKEYQQLENKVSELFSN